MTDKEIIKALECCITHDGNCNNCPICTPSCVEDNLENALDLIKRQQEEIVHLKAVIDEIDDFVNPLPFETDYEKAIKVARAEAIKEFTEKLKEINKERLILWNFHIDDLVKEMVGD